MHHAGMEATDVTDNPYQSSVSHAISMGIATLFAMLSASCCIIPLVLTVIGLGGAWLSVLGPFIAYREFILLGVTMIVLVMWWRVLRSGGLNRGAYMSGVATTAVLLRWIAPLWEWEVSSVLMNYWSGQQ